MTDGVALLQYLRLLRLTVLQTDIRYDTGAPDVLEAYLCFAANNNY